MGRPGRIITRRPEYKIEYLYPSDRRSSPAEHSSLIDSIITILDNRQYDELPDLLKRLGFNAGLCSIVVKLTTPPTIIDQLTDSGLTISLMGIYHLNDWKWQDLPIIAANLSCPESSRTIIQWNSSISGVLISYCQLTKTPFIISNIDYRPYDNYVEFESEILDQLLLEDIRELDDDNKETLHQIALHRQDYNCLRLLRESGHSTILSMCGIQIKYAICKLIIRFLWEDDNLDDLNNLRDGLDGEPLYTSSRYNNQWKKLTPQQIVSKHFNPEHLIRIGVEVPDINVILNDTNHFRILSLKLLLPYTDPTDMNIRKMLDKANGSGWYSYRCIHAIILMVRYKRELMMRYWNYELVRSLMGTLDIKRMKNSRTNITNY